jgi:hypothetical protein
MSLFDRIVELRVGDTEITGLDIAFEIEKDESPEPNPCHVDIYNLGPENRRTLSKYQRVPVTLKAGYKGSVGVIFKGDMVRCNHLQEQASWKTSLAIGDGAKAIQEKRCHKTFKKGTPIKMVLNDLTGQLELPSVNITTHIDKLEGTLARGFSVSGNPMAEINRILASRDLSLSIQNASLQIRKKGQPLQKEAISLSAETGLLASPEISDNNKIIVKALIMADFQPGRLVHLNSRMFNGFVTIEKVRFTGANFGKDWEAGMECKVG